MEAVLFICCIFHSTLQSFLWDTYLQRHLESVMCVSIHMYFINERKLYLIYGHCLLPNSISQGFLASLNIILLIFCVLTLYEVYSVHCNIYLESPTIYLLILLSILGKGYMIYSYRNTHNIQNKISCTTIKI